MEIEKYVETPELLEIDYNTDIGIDSTCEDYLHSGLLKSNCRVTSQPDWGDIYITLRGTQQPEPSSLLQYIISFRDELLTP